MGVMQPPLDFSVASSFVMTKQVDKEKMSDGISQSFVLQIRITFFGTLPFIDFVVKREEIQNDDPKGDS